MDCCYEEEEKCKDLENNLQECITLIKTDLNELKEQMLNLQSELKINIDYYHHIKKDISEYFIKFCKDTFNIYLGTGEQVIFIIKCGNYILCLLARILLCNSILEH